jgi:hypothetical protein
MLEARLPVTVMSSPVAFPSVTAPLSVAVPPTVSALMEKSFVPSDVPLMMSVKLVLTWDASAVILLLNVFVTDMFATNAPYF